MVRAGEEAAVPVLLYARPPVDAAEERTIRKLAGARHAPGDWIRRAQMIAGSWDGLGTTQIADRLGCHPQTVRERLHRFNAEGVDGLGDRPGPGRPRRLSETERGRIIALARSAPPGRLVQGGEGLLAAGPAGGAGALDPGRPGRGRPGRGHPGGPQPDPAHPACRRDALAADPLLDDQHRPRVRPKRAQVIALYTAPPPEVTVVCADELGPVIPRSFPPAPGWTADGHRVKAPLDYGRGPEKTWVYGALRVGDGQEVTMTAPSRNSVGYQRLLAAVEAANPAGTIVVITDNLSSHTSASHPHLAGRPPPHPARLHPQAGLLAEPAGGLVAAVSPPGPCRPVVCHPGGDHPGHQGGDLPAQRPRPALGLGPPTTVPTPPTTGLRVPPLRNGALVVLR